jgi:hypothetical protein
MGRPRINKHLGFIHAVHSNNVELARDCLQQAWPRPNINEKDIGGMTPLFIAVYHNCMGMAELLLMSKADISIPTNGGLTPLMWSVQQGNLNMAMLLLESGANPDTIINEGVLHDGIVVPSVGNTCLMVAALGGFVGIVRQLILHNTDVFVKNRYGATAYMMAESLYKDQVRTLEQDNNRRAIIWMIWNEITRRNEITRQNEITQHATLDPGHNEVVFHPQDNDTDSDDDENNEPIGPSHERSFI